MRETDQHKNRLFSPPPFRDCISDDDVTKGPEGLKLNWVSCARSLDLKKASRESRLRKGPVLVLSGSSEKLQSITRLKFGHKERKILKGRGSSGLFE